MMITLISNMISEELLTYIYNLESYYHRTTYERVIQLA